MRWWEIRKHLLVREKSRISEAFPDNNFIFEIRDNALWISGTILDFFEFECKYPSSYPFAPPDIFPKDRSSKWVPSHQYVKEGRFCLDIREKTWCSRLTAADIIISLQKLLIAQHIKEATKSDKLSVYEEPEPTKLELLLKNLLCVFPSDLSFPENENYGLINYIFHRKSDTFRFIVTDIFKGETKLESSIAKKIWLEDCLRNEYKGLWIRLNSDQFIEVFHIDVAKKFMETLKGYTILPEDFSFEEYIGKNSYCEILIVCDDFPSLQFLIMYNHEKQSISRFGVYIFDINHLVDRIPNKENFEFLKNKKVTIIGCGAGGSKDAEYLVKSGVGNIVLIDEDILKTENILRHSCQLDDLSIEKVYAIKSKLKRINPFVQIRTLKKTLNVIDAAVDELIHDSNLIIEATASNEEVFNEYAFSRGIPVIYSKVYPMGFGGEIIRIIPGVTPCYECSHHFKEVIVQENFPEAHFPNIQTLSYDTFSDGTYVPIPALAVDSDFISLIGVKMALEILIGNDSKLLTNSPHIRLWGNKKEWIFDQSYQCFSIYNDKIKSFPNCIVCYGENVIRKELGKANEQIMNEYTEMISNIKESADGNKVCND